MLLVLVAAVATQIAMRPELERRALIREIRASGGSVKTTGPLGDFWAGNVTEVRLPGGAFGVIDLARLKAFEKLSAINLGLLTATGAEDRRASVSGEVMIQDIDRFHENRP